MTHEPKFRPMGSRVQFERIANPKPKKDEIITNVTFEGSLRCRVLSVGPKCRDVTAGMIVIITHNVGMSVKDIAGRICHEDEILAMEVKS